MSLINIEEVSDKSIELVVDSAELMVDQMLQDGVLREIPILGTALKVFKIFIATKDYVLYKSILQFRYHLGDIPEDKKRKFIDRLQRDKDYRQRVGENLVLFLHRADDVRKYELMARIFKAHIEEEINDQEFDRLRIAVDRIRMYDLPALREFYSDSPSEKLRENDTLCQEFLYCGLVDIEVADGLVFGKSVSYKPNCTGELFVKLALGKKSVGS